MSTVAEIIKRREEERYAMDLVATLARAKRMRQLFVNGLYVCDVDTKVWRKANLDMLEAEFGPIILEDDVELRPLYSDL